MATQKQIAANRRNAKKSTGPRTQQGKSVSRLNARREGFTGQIVILNAEDRPFFEQFQSELVTSLQPESPLERSLAHAIAWDTWRLNHLRAVEMNIYALAAENPGTATASDSRVQPAVADADTFSKQSERFLRLSLYEQRLTRTLHKNLAVLRSLQAERRRLKAQDRAEEVLLARYSDIKGMTWQAPAAPSANGFVFSSDEILAAAHRASTLEVARATLREAPPKVQFAASSISGKIIDWPTPDAAA
ncbi:MAG TPA: hypothetical protein VN519_03965 [Bryobacteraceae bacterium]|nr:hypothetical protein [Bryobacteraceae bacterium]